LRPIEGNCIKSANGFTIIEVLISMGLLSVALLGGAALTVGIVKANAHSERVTTATMLAQQKMEELKNVGFALASDSEDDYGAIENFAAYRRIADVTDATNGYFRRATVTIFWDDNKKKVTLETMLARGS